MRSKINEKRTVSIGQYGFLVFDCFCLFLLSEITDKLVIVILLAFFSHVRPWRPVMCAHNIMLLKKLLAAINRIALKQLKAQGECRRILS